MGVEPTAIPPYPSQIHGILLHPISELFAGTIKTLPQPNIHKSKPLSYSFCTHQHLLIKLAAFPFTLSPFLLFLKWVSESDTIVCFSLHCTHWLHVLLASVVMMWFLIFVSSLLGFLLATVTVLGNLNAWIILTFAEKRDCLNACDCYMYGMVFQFLSLVSIQI